LLILCNRWENLSMMTPSPVSVRLILNTKATKGESNIPKRRMVKSLVNLSKFYSHKEIGSFWQILFVSWYEIRNAFVFNIVYWQVSQWDIISLQTGNLSRKNGHRKNRWANKRFSDKYYYVTTKTRVLLKGMRTILCMKNTLFSPFFPFMWCYVTTSIM